MTREEFFEKFELFAELPDAVPKMRELILRSAFSGRLSPGVDVERGAWAARTLADLAHSITPGFACSKTHQVEGGHVHLRTHNISVLGSLNFDLVVQIDPRKVDRDKASLKAGDILFNNTNSQELVGKTAFVDQDYEFGFSNHLTRIRVKSEADPRFVALYLTLLRNSGHFAATCTRWINQAAINTEALKRVSISLPPLGEQKRIVAKVEELMVLCDQLEAQQKERQTRHAALADASLSRFADAPTPANLALLFHKSYTIPPADLRKSILTLAVRGKLVTQDPNDEPVEYLLDRCLAERRQLNRTKLNEVRRVGTNEALGYDIPVAWRWQTLEDLLIFGPTNGFSPRAVDYATPVRSLTLSATTSGRFREEHTKFISEEVPADSDLWLQDGDVLVQRGNTIEYVGVAAVYRGARNRFVYPDLMMKIRLASVFSVDFIHLAMSEDSAREYLRARASGTSGSMPKINQSTLKGLPLPVPPFAEQRRIVTKVNQLMALTDSFEVQLATSRITAAKLLDSIVGQLTSASPMRRSSRVALSTVEVK